MNHYFHYLIVLILSCCATGCGTQSGIPILPVHIGEFEIEAANQRRDKFNEHVLSYNTQALTDKLHSISQSLESQLPDNNINFRFSILNTLHINAFALPDGQILMTSGLLIQFDNPNDLASVIAHEIGHVISRHSIKASQHLYATRARLKRSRFTALSDEEKQLLELMHEMKFSRQQELEADRIATELLRRAGFSPSQYAQTLKKLRALSKSDDDDVFSTHPDTEFRIQQTDSTSKTGATLQLDVPQYHSILKQTPIYRTYLKVASGEDGIIFRNEQVQLRFPGVTDISNISIDGASFSSAQHRGNIRIFSTDNLKLKLKHAYGQYKIDPLVLRDPKRVIKASSRLETNTCGIFRTAQIADKLIVIEGISAKPCRHSKTDYYRSIDFIVMDEQALDAAFLLGLGFRPAGGGSHENSDSILAHLFNGDAEEGLKWLNSVPPDEDTEKYFYRYQQ